MSRTLFCGDNYYHSFPNLYAIRGTRYRDVSRWITSLNRIIAEEADYLVSGHARPVHDRENVRKTLSDYRDALESVFTQSLEGMNRGLTPDQLVETVRLPEHLADKPDHQEFYGVIAWSVRSIYSGHMGWFDGNPSSLFPLSPKEEASRIVGIAGSKQQLEQIMKEAFIAEDYQWTCQVADYLLALDPDSREAKRTKAEALFALAERQLSSNARHYYLTVAKELLDN